MKWRIGLFSLLLLGVRGASPLPATTAPPPNTCATNYVVPACIGETVCVSATGTSAIVFPANLYRRYLLIQNQDSALPVYFAIGANTADKPLVAVAHLNVIRIVAPQGNYEVSALGATATPPTRVPTGAVAVISDGTPVDVCLTEGNG